MTSVIFIIIGIALVLHGADKMTDGAAAIARHLGVPQMVVGLTVVALGTSMPEFFVSLVSALKGTPDMALGNVVGSNIFNTTITVGVAAVVTPIAISRSTVRKDIPFAVASALMLAGMCLDGRLSRTDGIVLFAVFIVFMAYTLYSGVTNRKEKTGDGNETRAQQETGGHAVARCVFFVFLGLVELIIGGNIFVSGATDMARMLHVSEAVIGLTVVAGGTSLPEMATTIVAARKGRSEIAIGNVIGSNVFNILMIAGITSMISPLSINGITTADMSVVLVSGVLLWLMSYTKYTLERWEGCLLTVLFIAYITWLIYNLP